MWYKLGLPSNKSKEWTAQKAVPTSWLASLALPTRILSSRANQLVGTAYPYAKERVKVLQYPCWYMLRDRVSFALHAHSYQLVAWVMVPWFTQYVAFLLRRGIGTPFALLVQNVSVCTTPTPICWLARKV